ncbi:UDP-N-acetylmuramoyl-L-alanyl-D-glutamate--2,6-diaminopimelate ligase [Cohnella luojiensis]|nr:UDP-N-acetylmuramoyl-L-alanyl-D-glutamate--2,6-diaminopimelate ligase [Cohnella luojiensis]
MDLTSLLESVTIDYPSSTEIIISGIQFHSSKVRKGDLFVAIRGLKVDGHNYILEAIKAGAVAIVGEENLNNLSVPYYRVSNARKALALLASEFYENPSRRHMMIGITGTNGKTTTAHLLRYILESAGISCSLIGTVSHYINGMEIPSTQTTPDALQLQQLLYQSQDQVVIMEVSSHGIDQDRIHGIEYDLALFTNLSHDHLNYHKTLEDYFQTKARLFTQMKRNGVAIITSRCNWGKRLIDQLLTKKSSVKTFGDSDRDQIELIVVKSESPLKVEIREGDKHYIVSTSLEGIYNFWNVAAAWLTARQIGIKAAIIQNALQSFPGVPGRYEVYSHPNGAQFIIDYAHTPDGFFQFLRTLHARKPSRVIHIFGFRGNGDPTKRHVMLEISAAWSDRIILTQDDLNDVEPESILEQLHGFANDFEGKHCMVIEDRTKAIEYVWEQVGKGDLVAITGKGIETYDQYFALPCKSDRDTIQYLLNKETR